MSNKDVRIDTGHSSKTKPVGGPGGKTKEPEQHRRANAYLSSSRRTARSTSPAPVNALMTVLKERVKETPDLKDLNLISYSGKKDGSNLAGVAAYAIISGVVVMHFIASAAACELLPRDVIVGENTSHKVTFPTFVSDLYHGLTIGYIQEDIINGDKAVNRDMRFLNAGITVVRTKHTSTDFNDEAANYANVAWDAILDFAAHTRLTGEDLFDVSVLKGHQPRAQVSVQPQQVETIDGIPRRADLSVSVIAQQQGPEGLTPVELTRASGYMNFIFRQPTRQLLHGQQIQSQEYFQPEVIITEATAISHANTLETMLYAIYSIDSVIDQHRWLNLYKHNHAGAGKNSVNEYNLGGLNIDLPNINNKDIDNKVIPTGDPEWIESGLYQFASTYFTKTIGKAIDIPETGPTARLASIMRTAVVLPNMTREETEVAARARQQIIRAADNLTGKRFSAKLGSNPLFLPMIERTIIGTYVEDGVRKDINHVDHVSMICTFGEKDPDIVYRLESTFTKTEVAEVERLKERMDIYRQVKGASFESLELGYRIRLHPAAQAALAQSVAENNIQLHIDGVGSVEAQPERGAGYLQHGYGVSAESIQGFGGQSAGGQASHYGNSYEW